MKKVCILLVLVLLLGLSSSAWAEEDVWVEVIKMDGMSVVVLGDETLMMGEQTSFNAAVPEAAGILILPQALIKIEERAFEGITAARVDISENVESIGPYAFANCENLRTVAIPASVKEIDETAFVGCKDITIIGNGDAAKAIAQYYGFTIEEPDESQIIIGRVDIPPAPVLPPVSLR